MNKHSSVFMLMLRGMLFPVLGVLALMAVVQTALFQFTLSRAEIYCLEELFYQSRISVICGIAFLLVTVWMGHLYRDAGGRQSLTLRRLSVSERSVFFWQAICNIGCYLIFWAVQVGILLFLSRLFCWSADAEAFTNQSVLLAFYRNSFLHAMLPLADIIFYVRNILLILTLGLSLAFNALSSRHEQWAPETFAVIAATFLLFPQPSNNEYHAVLFFPLLAGVLIATLWRTIPKGAAIYEK